MCGHIAGVRRGLKINDINSLMEYQSLGLSMALAFLVALIVCPCMCCWLLICRVCCGGYHGSHGKKEKSWTFTNFQGACCPSSKNWRAKDDGYTKSEVK